MLFGYDHDIDLERQPKGGEEAAVPTDWTPGNVWEVRNGRVSKLRRREVLRARARIYSTISSGSGAIVAQWTGD